MIVCMAGCSECVSTPSCLRLYSQSISAGSDSAYHSQQLPLSRKGNRAAAIPSSIPFMPCTFYSHRPRHRASTRQLLRAQSSTSFLKYLRWGAEGRGGRRAAAWASTSCWRWLSAATWVSRYSPTCSGKPYCCCNCAKCLPNSLPSWRELLSTAARLPTAPARSSLLSQLAPNFASSVWYTAVSLENSCGRLPTSRSATTLVNSSDPFRHLASTGATSSLAGEASTMSAWRRRRSAVRCLRGKERAVCSSSSRRVMRECTTRSVLGIWERKTSISSRTSSSSCSPPLLSLLSLRSMQKQRYSSSWAPRINYTILSASNGQGREAEYIRQQRGDYRRESIDLWMDRRYGHLYTTMMDIVWLSLQYIIVDGVYHHTGRTHHPLQTGARRTCVGGHPTGHSQGVSRGQRNHGPGGHADLRRCRHLLQLSAQHLPGRGHCHAGRPRQPRHHLHSESPEGGDQQTDLHQDPPPECGWWADRGDAEGQPVDGGYEAVSDCTVESLTGE